MNTNLETSSELQIQICNYLANMINQIDNRLTLIESKLNNLQNNQNSEPPKKIKKTSHHQNTMNVDNDNQEDLELNYSGVIKQKITIARNEYELELLLKKEKEKWKQEFQLKQEIIDKHKIEWENEQKELYEKAKQQTFLYLS